MKLKDVALNLTEDEKNSNLNRLKVFATLARWTYTDHYTDSRDFFSCQSKIILTRAKSDTIIKNRQKQPQKHLFQKTTWHDRAKLVQIKKLCSTTTDWNQWTHNVKRALVRHNLSQTSLMMWNSFFSVSFLEKKYPSIERMKLQVKSATFPEACKWINMKINAKYKRKGFAERYPTKWTETSERGQFSTVQLKRWRPCPTRDQFTLCIWSHRTEGNRSSTSSSTSLINAKHRYEISLSVEREEKRETYLKKNREETNRKRHSTT